MSLARDAVGTGIAPEAFRALSVAAGAQLNATAAGSTQGTALAIAVTTGDVVIGTAAASTGVRLPTSAEGSQIGDQVTIANGGANAITLYPGTGEFINQLAVNIGIAVAAGAGAHAKRRTATLWVVV